MVDYVKALKWPVITWVILDIVFILLAPIKGMEQMLSTDVGAVLGIIFGLWVGYTIVANFKGTYGSAFVGGIAIGLVCLVLCLVGYGVFLKMGIAGSLPVALFMGFMNLSGALIGGGYALTK